MTLRVLTWNLFHGRSAPQPPLQRLVPDRRPDVFRSWSGGCNAILVRGQAIREHRVRRLRCLPERRVAHGDLLADGTWVTNLHAQAHAERRAQADLARAAEAPALQ